MKVNDNKDCRTVPNTIMIDTIKVYMYMFVFHSPGIMFKYFKDTFRNTDTETKDNYRDKDMTKDDCAKLDKLNLKVQPKGRKSEDKTLYRER